MIVVIVDVLLMSIDEYFGIVLYIMNYGEFELMECVFVCVDIDEGIEGWGEMCVFFLLMVIELFIEDGIGLMVVG